MYQKEISTIRLTHERPIYITYRENVKNNWAMPNMHYHPDYELFYIIDGGVSFIVNDKFYSLSKGDLLFMPPNSVHRSIYSTHNLTERFELCISPDILNNDTNEILNFLLNDCCLRSISLNHQTKVLSLFQSINKELNQQNSPYNYTLAATYVTELLVLLFRHSSPINNKKISPIIQDIISYIEENYFEELSPSIISNHFNISESNLYRKFNIEIGSTIIDYINYIRITKSEQLLLETNLRITDIAFKCGFNDSNYFSTVFKKYNGHTPREFRKRRTNFI